MIEKNTSPGRTQFQKSIPKIILIGLAVGTLDALVAVIQFMAKGGRNPVVIFNYIASGIFGTSAFSGGFAMAAIGLALHYLIAMCWTIFYFLLYVRLVSLSRLWIVSGVLYGFVVFLVMNGLVVPLSVSHKFPLFSFNMLISAAILILFIGLPIAFSATLIFPPSRK